MLLDKPTIRKQKNKIKEHFIIKSLTVLINRDASFIEMTDEDWDSVVSVHLKGTFIC